MGNKPTQMRRIMPLVAAVFAVTGAGAAARLSFAQEQQPPPPPPPPPPPTQPPAEVPVQQPDLLKALDDDPKLSRLATAIKAAGLDETLKTGGPYTIFAPTTSAFARLPDGAYDDLLKPENKEKLAGILRYHIVAGKLAEADFKEGAELKTLSGATVKVKLQPSVTVNDARVTRSDIQASNGVIHHIDAVLTPAPTPATPPVAPPPPATP